MDKRIGYGIAWVTATALAIALGVLAVTTVGASLRGRGPLGDEVRAEPVGPDQIQTPPADAVRVKDEITGDWGSFQVECRGVYAYGLKAEPAAAQGWRVISYEQGPDDDVDAVFSDGRRSVDLEVFCNRGRPTLAEIERNTLPET
ncbi:hypothetical protein ABIE44_003371 [Marmoricola sp. OAE513]|uniref:hypothetical protein n=1 Tax=Marmoricola sp. OAE513 TaxID=2817894 RepID=UPI001AEAEE10